MTPPSPTSVRAVPSRAPSPLTIDLLAESSPDVDPAAVALGVGLIGFLDDAQSALEWHFSRFGLTRARFEVLATLWESPHRNWSLAELAETARVSRASMTGIIDVLARDGLVERIPDANDGRRKNVALTERGAESVRRVLPTHYARLSAGFADADLGELREAVDRLAAVLDRIGSLTDRDA